MLLLFVEGDRAFFRCYHVINLRFEKDVNFSTALFLLSTRFVGAAGFEAGLACSRKCSAIEGYSYYDLGWIKIVPPKKVESGFDFGQVGVGI